MMRIRTESTLKQLHEQRNERYLHCLCNANCKVRGKKDRESVAQVFNVEISDAGVQATPSTMTTSTQTILSTDTSLRHLVRDGDEDTLRKTIGSFAEILGIHNNLLDEMFRKSKTTESHVMSESAVVRKHGPPPPYEASTTSTTETSRWPKFLTISHDGEVTHTGWVTFFLWSVVLFLLGLTTQTLFLPRYDLGALYPDTGYTSTFEMFGQRHWWEKWNMDAPVGKLVWRFGWWLDEWLREGGWPS
jgi:hypothetical protein